MPKKSKKSRKSLSLALCRDFLDFFGTFLALRADRPGTTFLTLFWHSGPGGPGTPCNWSLHCDSQSDFFLYGFSVEKGQLQGPLKLRNVRPPRLQLFGDLPPLSQSPASV